MLLFCPPHARKALDFAVTTVAALKPGEEVCISSRELDDIPSCEHKGFTWRAPDRVLEHIIGSSYEFGYREDRLNRSVIFYRLTRPIADDAPFSEHPYLSPDRRPWNWLAQVDSPRTAE
jgi:hypothetical protein